MRAGEEGDRGQREGTTHVHTLAMVPNQKSSKKGVKRLGGARGSARHKLGGEEMSSRTESEEMDFGISDWGPGQPTHQFDSRGIFKTSSLGQGGVKGDLIL